MTTRRTHPHVRAMCRAARLSEPCELTAAEVVRQAELERRVEFRRAVRHLDRARDPLEQALLALEIAMSALATVGADEP